MSASKIMEESFEIIVVLGGTIESTGQTKIQARTSYLNTEILWGSRFDQIVKYNIDKECYESDYSNFDSTVQVDTPLCSPSEY